MKVVGIVQTRMGSSRLPGKVLKPVLGVPVLEWCMERLLHCRNIAEVVIATTEHLRDEVICDFAKQKGYLCSRGSEEDVLGRYWKAARERGADAVVRLTSDCPLIDPEITDRVVARHLESPENDLTSNVFTRTFPRGFDTEVLSMDCLDRIHAEVLEPIYREHVTNYIHDYPEKFRIAEVVNSEDSSHLRLCVDTDEDLALIQKVFEELFPLNPHFGHREIYELFRRKPDLCQVNAKIQQAKIFKRKNRA